MLCHCAQAKQKPRSRNRGLGWCWAEGGRGRFARTQSTVPSQKVYPTSSRPWVPQYPQGEPILPLKFSKTSTMMAAIART